jgi:hypothetical protein
MLALSGTLDPLHLNDLLEWLHMTRATGRLYLTAGSVTRTFDLSGGKVIFASSSRAAERLASWLLRRKIASRPVLLRSLAISQIQGEPFTTVLLRESSVSKEDLVAAGSALAVALVSRILKEETVFFRFDPRYPVRLGEPVSFELSSSQLIMEAAVSADSRPPTDPGEAAPPTAFEPSSLEALFWSMVGDLAGTPLDPMELLEAHETFLHLGELLGRWIRQGPPLIPLPPGEVQYLRRILSQGGEPALEGAPTLAWDLLALVNGLDSPGFARASSLHEAWLMAGSDAPTLTEMLLESSRWRREGEAELDQLLARLVLGRAAAARALAATLGLGEETAATAAVLPLVLLALVLAALAKTSLSRPALRRATVQRLLPVLGQAAGTASGLPEVLQAGLTGEPSHHPGARAAALAAAAVGEGSNGEGNVGAEDPALAAAFAVAKSRAAEAQRQQVE